MRTYEEKTEVELEYTVDGFTWTMTAIAVWEICPPTSKCLQSCTSPDEYYGSCELMDLEDIEYFEDENPVLYDDLPEDVKDFFDDYEFEFEGEIL